MKIIVLLLLYLSTGIVLTLNVIGYAGGFVVIKCGYEKAYQRNAKYFCVDKNLLWEKCSDLIKTDLKDKWERRTRFSLYDNTTGGFFLVIFRALTPEDTGKYYCAVDIQLRDIYTEVDLTIRKDDCCEKVHEQTAYEGDTVNISCKFPLGYKQTSKYFCKEFEGVACKYSLSTRENQAWVSDEKLSLHDNREGVLTVSINSFSTSDAGSYWCGVDTGQYGAGITHVKLSRHRTLGPTEASQTTLLSSSLSSSSSSSSPSSPPTSSSLSSTFTPRTAPPAQGSRLVIPVFVSTTVIFIIIIIIIIFIIGRFRRKKTLGSELAAGTPPMGVTETRTQFSTVDVDYEEINGTSHPEPPQSENNTLYSLALLPISPSDGDDLYSTAQLPTSPSDGSPHTGVQMSSKPTDSVAYATVSFHQDPNRADKPFHVTKDNDGLSEYTSIKPPASVIYDNTEMAKP